MNQSKQKAAAAEVLATAVREIEDKVRFHSSDYALEVSQLCVAALADYEAIGPDKTIDTECAVGWGANAAREFLSGVQIYPSEKNNIPVLAEIIAKHAPTESALPAEAQRCMWAGCETSAIHGEFYCERHIKDGVLVLKGKPATGEQPGADWIESAYQLAKDFRAAWDAKDEDTFWEKFEEACLSLTVFEQHAPAKPALAVVSADQITDSERLDVLIRWDRIDLDYTDSADALKKIDVVVGYDRDDREERADQTKRKLQ